MATTAHLQSQDSLQFSRPEGNYDLAQEDEVDPVLEEVGSLVHGEIEPYAIQGKLQECLYGSVYRGAGLLTGDDVAVKILMKNGICEKEMDRELPETPLAEVFFAEELAGHKSFFNIREVFEAETSHFVISDLAKGEDLLELLKHYPLGMPEPSVRYFIRQAAEALAHCHSKGVAMQDFSLENCLLFLVDDPPLYHVRVCDPGQAVRFETHNGVEVPVRYKGCVGKRFRPPEIFLRAPYKATKVDSWCLGWSTFYLLFAIELFESVYVGDKDLRWRFLAAGRHNELFSSLGVKSRMSSVAKSFILSLLQPNPESRLSVRDALEHPFINEAPCPEKPETLVDLLRPTAEMLIEQPKEWTDEKWLAKHGVLSRFSMKEILDMRSDAQQRLSNVPIIPGIYKNYYIRMYCTIDKPSGCLLAPRKVLPVEAPGRRISKSKPTVRGSGTAGTAKPKGSENTVASINTQSSPKTTKSIPDSLTTTFANEAQKRNAPIVVFPGKPNLLSQSDARNYENRQPRIELHREVEPSGPKKSHLVAATMPSTLIMNDSSFFHRSRPLVAERISNQLNMTSMEKPSTSTRPNNFLPVAVFPHRVPKAPAFTPFIPKYHETSTVASASYHQFFPVPRPAYSSSFVKMPSINERHEIPLSERTHAVAPLSPRLPPPHSAPIGAGSRPMLSNPLVVRPPFSKYPAVQSQYPSPSFTNMRNKIDETLKAHVAFVQPDDFEVQKLAASKRDPANGQDYQIDETISVHNQPTIKPFKKPAPTTTAAGSAKAVPKFVRGPQKKPADLQSTQGMKPKEGRVLQPQPQPKAPQQQTVQNIQSVHATTQHQQLPQSLQVSAKQAAQTVQQKQQNEYQLQQKRQQLIYQQQQAAQQQAAQQQAAQQQAAQQYAAQQYAAQQGAQQQAAQQQAAQQYAAQQGAQQAAQQYAAQQGAQQAQQKRPTHRTSKHSEPVSTSASVTNRTFPEMPTGPENPRPTNSALPRPANVPARQPKQNPRPVTPSSPRQGAATPQPSVNSSTMQQQKRTSATRPPGRVVPSRNVQQAANRRQSDAHEGPPPPPPPPPGVPSVAADSATGRSFSTADVAYPAGRRRSGGLVERESQKQASITRPAVFPPTRTDPVTEAAYRYRRAKTNEIPGAYNSVESAPAHQMTSQSYNSNYSHPQYLQQQRPVQKQPSSKDPKNPQNMRTANLTAYLPNPEELFDPHSAASSLPPLAQISGAGPSFPMPNTSMIPSHQSSHSSRAKQLPPVRPKGSRSTRQSPERPGEYNRGSTPAPQGVVTEVPRTEMQAAYIHPSMFAAFPAGGYMASPDAPHVFIPYPHTVMRPETPQKNRRFKGRKNSNDG